MDLYVATVHLDKPGAQYRACITDKYYEYLVNKNMTYKARVEDGVVEIPIGNFRKEKQ